MSGHQDPTWALLAQASAKTLQRLIDQGPPRAQWRVVRGTGEVNALVDDEPGTEHSGERELAEALSREARCHVIYFDPPWVSRRLPAGGVGVRLPARRPVRVPGL